MDTSFEQKVRERAYEIWVAAGMSDGNATDHWLSAQHALLTECEPTVAGPAIQKAKVTKRASAATTAKPAKVTSSKAATAKTAKPKTRAA